MEKRKHVRVAIQGPARILSLVDQPSEIAAQLLTYRREGPRPLVASALSIPEQIHIINGSERFETPLQSRLET